MKSSRRRELKTSDLAVQLEQAKEFFNKYGSQIAAVAVLIVVVVVVGLYLRASGQATRQQGWTQLGQVLAGPGMTETMNLEQLATEAGDPNLAAIAWKLHGDQLLRELADADPIRRDSLADRAARAYKEVLDKHNDHWIAAAGALIGLGVLAEDMGRWSEAGKYYQQLLADDRFVDTTFAKVAQQRFDALDELSKPVIFPSSQPAATQAAK